MLNGVPVYWSSKVSSVAFVSADIGEAHADTSSAATEVYCAGNATKDLLHLSYVADEIGFPSQSHSNCRWTMNQLYHLQTIAPSSLSLSILMLGKNGYESYEIKRFVLQPQSIPRITWLTSSQRFCKELVLVSLRDRLMHDPSK